MHGLVRECKNIFNLEIYYIVREKLSNIFFILCPRKQRHTSHRIGTCMTPRRRCFTRPSSVVNGLYEM